MPPTLAPHAAPASETPAPPAPSAPAARAVRADAWDPMRALASQPAPPSAARLRARLDDPATAAALDALLDRAELLATLLTMVDGTVRRADDIVEAVGEGMRDARGTVTAALPDADTREALQRLVGIGRRMLDHHTLEAITRLTDAALPVLESGLLDPRLVRSVSHAGAALATSYETTRAAAPPPLGPLGLLRALFDPDVRRGLGFAVAMARTYGRSLATPPVQVPATTPAAPPVPLAARR